VVVVAAARERSTVGHREAKVIPEQEETLGVVPEVRAKSSVPDIIIRQIPDRVEALPEREAVVEAEML
jgi:hypothetical protein